jgi:iron complex transport system substrate-binding protein
MTAPPFLIFQHSRQRRYPALRAGLVTGLLLCCLLPAAGSAQSGDSPPLPMDELKKTLSLVRGKPQAGSWPRTVRYTFRVYDFKADAFHQEEKTFTLARQPARIIPHAAGVAEILWAICPRERLAAFNEFSADPEFSFIADAVRQQGPVFKTKQTELVIGFQPDLVFTVFYSGAEFKEKLRQAKIPCFDLGYFGSIESIREQILLIGKIIGEETNAQALVNLIGTKIAALKAAIPGGSRPVRVLYYDEGGYIPGRTSNFNSICGIIGAINVGAEQGIKSWSQVDNETLLKWDPDVIIVPRGSSLKDMLMSSRVLSYAQAIRKGKVYEIPGVYLRVDSQFILLSADLLAGVIYAQKP